MLVGCGQEELADADVVDQQAVVVDDVDDVERFAVLAVRADVIEHLGDGPVFLHADVVRRHQTPDRAFRISEQLHGVGALLGREQREELPRRLRGELFEERRAIVGRHVVQERGGLFRRHRPQERVLLVGRQIGEGFGGGLPRQNAEHEDAFLERQIREHRGDVARGPVAQHVAEPAKSRSRMIAAISSAGRIVSRTSCSAASRLGPFSSCSICISAARTTSWWCTLGPTARTTSSQSRWMCSKSSGRSAGACAPR